MRRNASAPFQYAAICRRRGWQRSFYQASPTPSMRPIVAVDASHGGKLSACLDRRNAWRRRYSASCVAALAAAVYVSVDAIGFREALAHTKRHHLQNMSKRHCRFVVPSSSTDNIFTRGGDDNTREARRIARLYATLARPECTSAKISICDSISTCSRHRKA